MLDQRCSDNDQSKRDIPSFIEPRPPLIQNPFMRPRPQKGTNLMELFEEDSEVEEPELVQVYLRLKPCSVPNNLYEVRSERCLVTSMDTTTAGHGRRTQHNLSKMYTFSRIFGPECSQKEIFELVVKDNLKKLPDGQSFTLLTYGASGSGKTYTLMGTVGSPGLVPRSLEYVFKLVDAAQHPLHKPADNGAEKLNYAEQEYEMQWVKRLRYVSAPLRDKYRRMSAQLHSNVTVSSIDLSTRTKHYVWVSFVEIYNEAIYDLLAPPDKRTKLHIREDSSGNVYVKGARQAFVRSGEEAYDVMVAGKHNLVVAATGVHAHSSRSHCIFTITMLTETVEGEIRTSCVRLCDLAGCERARATRNTGARMQESRAINSSLHVLERCLHVLRRNQRHRHDVLVPYRESKLTRLLGSGLSGARGEAVGMVVTLNPAPQYAHETRHVLSLAAVAQDIQINNTIFASTTSLETTQDTTINTSAEVMKLRSDNERLHFELIQAHSRNKELTAAMETRQQQTADTMRELVEEAKDLTRQYYEDQLHALRAEMDAMEEEYECRLAKTAAPPTSDDTSSQHLQSKVTELMTEIAVLEEKLTEERLARGRAEKEVQHLRTCIEERDEKAFKDSESQNREDVISVTDSEYESDEEMNDPLNESLEPQFKREDSNKTQSIQKYQQISQDNCETDDGYDNKSNDTLKNYETCDETDTGKDYIDAKYDECVVNKKDDDLHNSVASNNTKLSFDICDEKLVQTKEFDDVKNESMDIKFNSLPLRGIDLVEHKINNSSILNDNTKLKKLNLLRGTYCVKDSDTERPDDTFDIKTNVNDEKIISSSNTNEEIVNYHKDTEKQQESLVINKKITLFKTGQSSDSSLRQFEQLEMASKACNNDSRDKAGDFGEIKILTEKRTYFDDDKSGNSENFNKLSFNKEIRSYLLDNSSKEISNDMIDVKITKQKRTFFDNIDANIDTTINNKLDDVILQNANERSPSIVKENAPYDFEPKPIKKLLGEPLIKQPVIISSIQKNNIKTKHDSVDIFEGFDSPHISKVREIVNNLEIARKSVAKLTLNEITHTKIKSETISFEKPKLEPQSSVEELKEVPNLNITEQNLQLTRVNSTIEDFENIYKDITAPRATEFDLLVTQEINTSNNKDVGDIEENTVEINQRQKETQIEDTKYNLRRKGHTKSDKDDFPNDNRAEEILAENRAKLESKTSNRRNLRLRRRKNVDEYSDQEDQKVKLKDIVNLQEEFSDVTMDLPATRKEVKDIPSPAKGCEEENVPPILGIQSCPSRSIVRSRRKLFTPRAEPLEESVGHTGDSTERIYVPRPSYHRTRARRKL